MGIEVKQLSLWDTLRFQLYLTVPGFLLGLVVPNRWFVSLGAKWGAASLPMRLLRDLRDKYGCDHLWLWFPLGRTLLVLAPATMEAVLASDQNAADPSLKKRALSRFVPDALVISSGAQWRDRRSFNESVLDSGKLHRYGDAFAKIALAEAQRLTDACAGALRWADFQTLGERISQQAILGAGEVDPALTLHLSRMLRFANLLLRHAPSFSAFYERIGVSLDRKSEGASQACLMHESAKLLEDGSANASTRVPTQIGFWVFVLKDAIELHVARTLALIAAHPDVQTRVREEIRAAGALSAHAIDGLHYLEACIVEQLRLWTPVPLLLRRAVTSFSLRDEIAIEAGQQILIPAGFYHRDRRAFGERADTFSPGAGAGGEASPVYVFSAHRQSCAGRSLVTLVLKATLASLLARFRFELVAPAIQTDRIDYLYNHFDIELRAVPDA